MLNRGQHVGKHSRAMTRTCELTLFPDSLDWGLDWHLLSLSCISGIFPDTDELVGEYGYLGFFWVLWKRLLSPIGWIVVEKMTFPDLSFWYMATILHVTYQYHFTAVAFLPPIVILFTFQPDVGSFLMLSPLVEEVLFSYYMIRTEKNFFSILGLILKIWKMCSNQFCRP